MVITTPSVISGEVIMRKVFYASRARISGLFVAIAIAPFFAVAHAQPVYQSPNLVIGYVRPGAPANVAGYSRCFTSIGNYVWLRSDNSDNIEPVFEVTVANNSVLINKNAFADGIGAYVCFNDGLNRAEVTAGTVASGTVVGAGLSCVTSIANFIKARVNGGTVPGSVSCTYDSISGRITASATEAGQISECNYICAKPSETKTTQLTAWRYQQIFSGAENIGANLNCAKGANYFYFNCSNALSVSSSYDPRTGVATRGFSDGCGRQSYSYLCAATPRTQCADGFDNDSDGVIDAQDPGCWSNPSRPETYDPNRLDESVATTQCQDGIDNDGDGAIDLFDFSCQNTRIKNDEASPRAQCQDGIDNDSDGAVDLADFSCGGNRQKNDEVNPRAQCQDGLDNDGDGAADLADFSCGGDRQRNEEANPRSQCQDGIDNDNDGATDLADFSCGGDRQRNDETNPRSQCQDSIDNDGDGAVDLADFSCVGNRQKNDEANPQAQCQDGIDNDNDGAIDLADFGCGGNRQNNDEAGNRSQCQDGIDNDGDGAIDTADFSCAGPQDNDETNPKAQCQDGIDNDGDGAVDLADFSCGGNRQKNDEANPRAQCQDGIDNDNDGAVDLADFSCSGNRQKNDEANPRAQCQDSIDNDNDGAIDLADFSCGGNRQNNDESGGKSQCQDGIDNDGDGAIDTADFSCAGPQDNDETNPKAQCQDGLDNDNDGAVDLSDFSCSGNRQKNDEANPRAQCQDLIDNDGDGAIDLADFSCGGNRQNNDESGGRSQCQDGIDNDGDGAIDTADFSCAGPQDNDETNPKAQCQDGIDNDSDGATDVADFSCSGNQDNDEANPRSQCQDGIDNDQDSLVDTKDPGCSNNQDNNEGDEQALLEVGLECVFDNQDGSFTAYFGYENRTARDIQVVSDPSTGTVNEFGPGAPDRGQPTTFRIGRQRGVVPVLFNGQSVTWRVRAAGSKLSTATAVSNSTPCQRLNPIVDCINGSANGLVATFGYNNPNAFDVVIPIGALNNVSPAPIDRGQPRVLKSGRNAATFSTTFTQSVTWNLDGAPATINQSTRVCEGGCIDRPIGTIKNELNKTALDLAALTKRAAELLAQRANQSASRGQILRAVASRVGLDAKRAARRADVLARRAQSITLGFPEVIKSCPFSLPFCQTVDRGREIDQLRGLYVEQLDQLRRIMARRNFTQTGSTSRQDPLVTEARRVKSEGDAKLSEIPRIDTKCS